MKSNDEDIDLKYPLLSSTKRINTIKEYLAYELFCYPELRKILRDKYYKKLVISTTPTKKGDQDISLYSSYFPVKRIKEKPISTLKREAWILAKEAEKLDLIKIDLKFEWELSSTDSKNFESDNVYLDLTKSYFDINLNESGNYWNIFRKLVLTIMLENYFFPSFMKEIREDLTKEGQRDIINTCCNKFKSQLFKGPSMRIDRPVRILSMVLQNEKLGVAFVDE